MSKLVVIDCNYLCHRALYTTGPLEYKGVPTGIIFGFLNQLAVIGQTLLPSQVVFTWDSRKSIRRECYPFYKDRGNKESDPLIEQAFKQFNLLREEIIGQLGFKNNFIQEGYEADDLMASICHDQDAVLTTSDDDMLQALRPGVEIYNLGRREMMTFRDFRRQYGIKSSQWAKVKQIAGCPGDTVPGIPGVGTKMAIKYLTGNLKPTTKTYQAITSLEGRRIANRNEWLVKLPLPGTQKPDIQVNKFNKQELIQLCKKYGFLRWLGNPQWIDDWEVYFG